MGRYGAMAEEIQALVDEAKQRPGACVEVPNSYFDLLIRSMPIQMGQAAKEMTDQQDQQWRDLAGL